MKKCPECGNPSYDGAPACGNCGYKFPKMKPSAPKKEIFDKAPEKKKKQFSDEESTIEIIKENKILIGAIILITIIVICGIVITGPNNNNQTAQSGDMVKFSEAGFSFSYPSSWNEVPRDHGVATDHIIDTDLVHHEFHPFVEDGVIICPSAVYLLDPGDHAVEMILGLSGPRFMHDTGGDSALSGVRQHLHDRAHSVEMLFTPKRNLVVTGHGIRVLP